MTAWNENGYSMKSINGKVFIFDHDVWYEFIRWDSDDNGAIVAVVKFEIFDSI